jgi:hypothetical protein
VGLERLSPNKTQARRLDEPASRRLPVSARNARVAGKAFPRLVFAIVIEARRVWERRPSGSKEVVRKARAVREAGRPGRLTVRGYRCVRRRSPAKNPMALRPDSRSNRSAGASEQAGCNRRKPASATGRNGGRRYRIPRWRTRDRQSNKYRAPDPAGHGTPAPETPRAQAWPSGLRATPTSFRSSVGDGETCWAESRRQ